MKKRNTPPPARRHSGFTLIEMLIVVAIIAILIAVSIPMVNNALERARLATDAANERSAKAEATIMFLDGQLDEFFTKPDDTVAMPYDAVSGELLYSGTKVTRASNTISLSAANVIPAYGKCTTTHDGKGPHSDCIIWAQVDGSGVVKIAWGKDETTTAPTNFDATSGLAAAHGTVLTNNS